MKVSLWPKMDLQIERSKFNPRNILLKTALLTPIALLVKLNVELFAVNASILTPEHSVEPESKRAVIATAA